jgi:ATP-dependent RNA helicase DeaD
LVFCRTRTEVDELTETLRSRGYRPEAIHGGMSQEQRTRVMRLFRAGSANLLIATDVAARGLDIDQLSHVVNYDVPTAPESYVHRIGRVGRAGREGVAITLAEPRERGPLRNIERLTGQQIEVAKVPSAKDLQARRLQMSQAALRTALEQGDLEQFRCVVAGLAGEFDLMDIAMAAFKLLHLAGRGQDDEEADIPTATPERDNDRGARNSNFGKPRRPTGGRNQTPGMTRIFVGAGRAGGITPRDLVGAIANEAGVPGTDIGLIDIAERFSLVEVPEEVADYVVDSLSGSRIKGRKVTVRLERY